MFIKKITVLVLLIALLQPCFAVADEYGAAIKHLKAGEFSKAKPILLGLANSGNSFAQQTLGTMYLKGDGVKKDVKQSAYWYGKAAASGNKNRAVVDSMYSMAIFFNGYKGHPKDFKKMFYWFSQAAHMGDVASMNQLGILYYDGNGIEKSYSNAFIWFSNAAKRNHPVSQSFLGDLYRFGRSVKQDYAEAFRWYEKSASSNYPHALYMLAAFYGQGLGVKKDREKANTYYKKAAAVGHPEAKKYLASIQASDITIKGIAKDPEYGYSSEKAIRTGGPGSNKQKRYLNKLRGPNGELIQYKRTGRCGAYKYASAPFGQAIIDCYAVRYEGLEESVTLFVDLYREEALYAPNGFTFKN